MAEEITDDDDDFEGDDEMLDEYEEDLDSKPVIFRDSAAARRRLEQIKEEKALERLLNGDFDDWN